MATNDEARELNACIRDTRVSRGVVDDARTTTGNDDLNIGSGDAIQTRHNDSDLGVANRQIWTVQRVGADGAIWARENTNGRKKQRTVRLPAAYVAEHAHLAYASTAYGVQGTTVPESDTVLSESLDGSGVYVGMTRARDTNRLHIVATDLEHAREQFVLALARDHADRGLAAATESARGAVAGLTVDGPVNVVNTERVRLTQLIEHADRQTVHWEHAAAALDHQQREHQTKADKQQAVLASAAANAERVRAEVAAPLIEQATTDGTAYLAVRDRVWAASDAQRSARGFRQRSADRTLATASDEHHIAETTTRRRWGSLPQTPDGIEPWATVVAQHEADTDPRVTETHEQADQVRREQQHLTDRQMRERTDLRRQVFGNHRSSSPQTQAARWREQAEVARHDLTAIESLPVAEAAELVRAKQVRAQREAAENVARQSRAALPHGYTRPPPEHGPTPREQELGM